MDRHERESAAFAVWHAARSATAPPSPERCVRVREKLAEELSLLLVVERNAEVVGMLLAESFRRDAGGGAPVDGVGHVSMVFVHPQHQRSGVGRELLELLIRDGRWPQLSLWTGETNVPARALYRAVGFEPSGDEGQLPDGRRIGRWSRPALPPALTAHPG